MDIRLSVFFIATFYLIFGGIISIIPIFPKVNKELKQIIFKGKFQMRMGVYGIIAVVLFAIFPYDKILLFGDFIPMLTGFISSILFITGYIRISKHIDQKTLSRAEKILSALQVPSGFASIFIGLVHIIIPKFIFF